jgi:hypothetical protein
MANQQQGGVDYKSHLLEFLRQKQTKLALELRPDSSKHMQKKHSEQGRGLAILEQFGGGIECEDDVDGIACLTKTVRELLKRELARELKEIRNIRAMMPALNSGNHAILVTLLRAKEV